MELIDELENKGKMDKVGKMANFKTMVDAFSHILPVIRQFFVS